MSETIITIVKTCNPISISNVCPPISVNGTLGNPITVSSGTTVNINSGNISAVTSPFVAGEAITAYDVVIAIGNELFRASAANVTHVSNVVGIALQSAITGDSVDVTTQGRVTNSGWNFNSSQLVFLE